MLPGKYRYSLHSANKAALLSCVNSPLPVVQPSLTDADQRIGHPWHGGRETRPLAASKWVGWFGIVAIGAIVSAGNALASAQLAVSGNAGSGYTGDSFSWNGTAPQAGSAAAGGASAIASASFGVLRASAYGASSDWDNYFVGVSGAGANSTAYFQDSITLIPSNPALMGTTGYFTASMHLSGSVSAFFNVSTTNGYWYHWNETGYPSAGGSLILQVGSASNGTGASTSLSGSGSQSGGASVSETVALSVPFIYGTPLIITARLQVDAGAFSREGGFWDISTAGGSANFGNSATWQGISDVIDQTGPVALGSVSFQSESGTDYSVAIIPEPTTAILLGLGLMGFVSSRRR